MSESRKKCPFINVPIQERADRAFTVLPAGVSPNAMIQAVGVQECLGLNCNLMTISGVCVFYAILNQLTELNSAVKVEGTEGTN